MPPASSSSSRSSSSSVSSSVERMILIACFLSALFFSFFFFCSAINIYTLSLTFLSIQDGNRPREAKTSFLPHLLQSYTRAISLSLLPQSKYFRTHRLTHAISSCYYTFVVHYAN